MKINILGELITLPRLTNLTAMLRKRAVTKSHNSLVSDLPDDALTEIAHYSTPSAMLAFARADKKLFDAITHKTDIWQNFLARSFPDESLKEGESPYEECRRKLAEQKLPILFGASDTSTIKSDFTIPRDTPNDLRRKLFSAASAAKKQNKTIFDVLIDNRDWATLLELANSDITFPIIPSRLLENLKTCLRAKQFFLVETLLRRKCNFANWKSEYKSLLLYAAISTKAPAGLIRFLIRNDASFLYSGITEAAGTDLWETLKIIAESKPLDQHTWLDILDAVEKRDRNDYRAIGPGHLEYLISINPHEIPIEAHQKLLSYALDHRYWNMAALLLLHPIDLYRYEYQNDMNFLHRALQFSDKPPLAIIQGLVRCKSAHSATIKATYFHYANPHDVSVTYFSRTSQFDVKEYVEGDYLSVLSNSLPAKNLWNHINYHLFSFSLTSLYLTANKLSDEIKNKILTQLLQWTQHAVSFDPVAINCIALAINPTTNLDNLPLGTIFPLAKFQFKKIMNSSSAREFDAEQTLFKQRITSFLRDFKFDTGKFNRTFFSSWCAEKLKVFQIVNSTKNKILLLLKDYDLQFRNTETHCLLDMSWEIFSLIEDAMQTNYPNAAELDKRILLVLDSYKDKIPQLTQHILIAHTL